MMPLAEKNLGKVCNNAIKIFGKVRIRRNKKVLIINFVH